VSTSSLARSDLGPPTHSISDNSCLPCVAPVADRQMSSTVASEESEVAPGKVSGAFGMLANDAQCRDNRIYTHLSRPDRLRQAQAAEESCSPSSGGPRRSSRRGASFLSKGAPLGENGVTGVRSPLGRSRRGSRGDRRREEPCDRRAGDTHHDQGLTSSRTQA
jgi:hypothetical protein